MAGKTVQISGIILKKEISGEQFFKLTILSPERGIVMAMLRRPKRNARSPMPDLFDKVEILLERKGEDGFGFVKELSIHQQRRGLTKSFIALELACEWSSILAKNLARETEVEKVYQLFSKGLDAWERRIQPEAIFFKSLFVYARDEGYAVKHDWFEKLKHSDRTEVAMIINTPIPELQIKSERVLHWNEELKHYIQYYTDILL